MWVLLMLWQIMIKVLSPPNTKITGTVGGSNLTLPFCIGNWLSVVMGREPLLNPSAPPPPFHTSAPSSCADTFASEIEEIAI